jgi:sugar transferase EpsL
MKRLLDVGLVTMTAPVWLPLVAFLTPVVSVALRGTPFFRQTRIGLNGRPFTIIKFRTMRDAHDTHGELLPDAARLTRFGRMLRTSSLDELPELWNVLRGDMSLVGPRPLLPEYLPLYFARQARRHEVRPGMTGWAQVNGRNALSWDERLDLDVWYVDNQSILLDLRILFRTLRQVVYGEGISAPGEPTMPKFRGSTQ